MKSLKKPSGFYPQFHACLKKNAWVQWRQPLGNIGILLAPLVAVFMLLLTQNSVSNHLDDVNALTCGCKCIECCDGAGYCYNATISSPCSPYSKCIRHDLDSCGYLHSTVKQVPFCEVQQPPLWPSVIQVPPGSEGKAAYMLYTGTDMGLAKDIMGEMLTPPKKISAKVAESYVKSLVLDEIESEDYEDSSDITDEQSEMIEFIDATGALTRGVYDFGVILGTSASSSDTLLIESAFVPRGFENNSGLYILMDQTEADSVTDSIINQIGTSIGNLTGISVSSLPIQYVPVDSAKTINERLFQSWILTAEGGNDEAFLAAFDWHSSNRHSLNLDIWVNDSQVYKVMDIPDIQRWAQPVSIAVNAYLRHFWHGSGVLAGVRDMPRHQNDLNIDFSTLFGPLLTMWLMHVILPVQLYFLVYEKERGLRIFQFLNGLHNLAYYLACYVWHLFIYICYMACFMGLAVLFGIKMFTLNSYSIQAIFLLLWGLVIVGTGFLFAVLYNDRRAVALSSIFYIVIMGFLANVFLVIFIEQEMNVLVNILQSIVPSFCAFRGLYELSQYAFLADQSGVDQALTWDIDDPSMRIVLLELFAQSLILPVLAFYFDHVSGAIDGIKKDYMSIFKRKENKIQPKPKKASEEESPMDSDVDEMDYYLGYLNGGAQYGNTFKEAKKRTSSLDLYLGTSAVISDKMRGMEKEIDSPRNGGTHAPSSLLLSQSFIEHGGSSVICHGVKKVYKDDPSKGIHLPSLAIQEQEIFALVGSAGSGKTSVLRMMQGTLRQSEGVICVQGVDSKDHVPLKVRIGVVSDMDLLWHNLTGMEVLMFFLRIKLGNRVNAKKCIDNVVEILDLHSSINNLVSKYSGGMRRRLSLAISLLGFPDKNLLPSTIFLDEPCMNMDPYSRKVLWKALHEVKKASSIIMATSNVLEAESCDRILVLKQGQAIYLGSPKQMIHKYGGFAWLTFTVAAEHRNKVFKFVNSSFSGCEMIHEIGQRILFSVPLEPGTQTIDSIFRKVEKARIESITILDWSVSNLSLEDVYLNLIEND